MNSVSFSVVIPTYNQGFFIKQSIDSVLSQTFKDYEIIVIDDYSEDQTQEIVKGFNNKKINYKRMKNKKNIGKSRNEGINLSKGNWIAFLDSDDFWYPQRLEVISNFLKNNLNYDVICTDELINDKIRNRKKIWKYGPFTDNFYEKLLKFGNCLSTSASIVRKDFLINKKIQFNEDPNFFTAEDYEFFLKLANSNAEFKFLHQVLGEHLFYENSNSANYELHKEAVKSVVKHHVFNVQTFSKNKEKLWDALKVNFYLQDVIFLFFYKKKYLRSILFFFKTFFIAPLRTSNLTLNKLRKFFIINK